MDSRAYYKLSDGKLIGVFNRTGRKILKADEELCQTIREQNVLVIDDVTTSGSTLGEVLRTLRILNEDNRITIFSLIGRSDLMADVTT